MEICPRHRHVLRVSYAFISFFLSDRCSLHHLLKPRYKRYRDEQKDGVCPSVGHSNQDKVPALSGHQNPLGRLGKILVPGPRPPESEVIGRQWDPLGGMCDKAQVALRCLRV